VAVVKSRPFRRGSVSCLFFSFFVYKQIALSYNALLLFLFFNLDVSEM